MYAPGQLTPWQVVQPHDPNLVPRSVVVSRDHQTYLAGSNVNPGYGYGTFIPLFTQRLGLKRWGYPYTLPAAPNGLNQIKTHWNNSTVWGDSTNVLRIKGPTTAVPGVPVNYNDPMATRLANSGML